MEKYRAYIVLWLSWSLTLILTRNIFYLFYMNCDPFVTHTSLPFSESSTTWPPRESLFLHHPCCRKWRCQAFSVAVFVHRFVRNFTYSESRYQTILIKRVSAPYAYPEMPKRFARSFAAPKKLFTALNGGCWLRIFHSPKKAILFV
jgi:hypothetical protein